MPLVRIFKLGKGRFTVLLKPYPSTHLPAVMEIDRSKDQVVSLVQEVVVAEVIARGKGETLPEELRGP